MDSRRQALVGGGRVVALALALAVTPSPALAHGGSLGRAARESLTVPTWLVVLTGGAVVGASFLLASFATDRDLVASVHARRRSVAVPGIALLAGSGRLLGVVVLAGVLAVGFVGPTDPLSNAAVLVVWAGWWAGFSMSTYLVGNAWPVLNPWRAVATALPDVGRTYEWRWGHWPGVVGLLAIVWVEVVSPLADRPRVLAVTVLAYSAVTVGGAVVYGPGQWFEEVDPVARVFRAYGHVAPVSSGTGESSRLTFRVPGAGLTDAVADRGDAAFVVALLWVTTFDGFVTTPLWDALARGVVDAGVPAVAVYPIALLGGYALFLGAYLSAARLARRTAPTYVDAPTLARRFAPALLAIAAGYHLAHFLDYFLALLPALFAAVASPFSTTDPVVLVLPEWFGAVGIAGVLAGHVLAVAAAHAIAFELFPGRLQAIRSQYSFTAVMVCYTMVSLWVVTRPEVPPPFL